MEGCYEMLEEYFIEISLICSLCHRYIHILEFSSVEGKNLKTKCKCGIRTQTLEKFLEINSYIKKDEQSKIDYVFTDKSGNNAITLDTSNLNCKHGNKSNGFCHTCSEYLCSICLNEHKNHVVYDEKMIKDKIHFSEFVQEIYGIFENSLKLNYKLLINQIDTIINQLTRDKEEIEKNYRNNINNNKLLYDLALGLQNNYILSPYNYVNYANFANFSHPNNIFKMKEVLSPLTIHSESLKFIEYCKNQHFIIILPKNDSQLSLVRPVIEMEEEDPFCFRFESNVKIKQPSNDEIDKMLFMKKKKMEFDDDYIFNINDGKWVDDEDYNYDYDKQEEEDFECKNQGKFDRLPYSYDNVFDLNCQTLMEYMRSVNTIKHDPYNNHSIKTEPRYDFSRFEFLILSDYRLAIFVIDEDLIIIVSLITFKTEMEINIAKIDERITGTRLRLHSLSNGGLIYIRNKRVSRIKINSSSFTVNHESIKVRGKLRVFLELSNHDLLLGTLGYVYIVENSYPLVIKKEIRRDHSKICEINDNYFLFTIPFYKQKSFDLVDISSNKVIKTFNNITFSKSIKLPSKNRVLLIDIPIIVVFNMISLEQESIIQLSYEPWDTNIFTLPPDNEQIAFCINSNKECVKVDLNTFTYKTIPISPEQQDIQLCFALPDRRLLIGNDKKISIFKY